MTQAAPSGGSGDSSSSGSSYNIKPNTVSPAGEEESMGYQEIMQNLHNLKPGDVASAADAFKNLGTVLDNIASDLANTGNQLSQQWQGAAAQAAMTKFQQLHDQAAQLAAQAHTTSNVAGWVGNDVLPQYKNIPDPQVMSKSESDAVIGGAIGGPGGAMAGTVLGAFGIGSDGSAKADQAARGYLASLNGHLATANASLPNTVTGPNSSGMGGLGTLSGSTTHTGSGTGSGYGGSGYGGVGGSGGTGPGPGVQNYPTPGGTTPVKLPTGGPGPTGTLQGYTPPPGGGSVPPFGGGSPGGLATGGGSANPFSRMAMMPGGGSGFGGGDEGLPGEGSGLAGEDALAGESGLANGADTGSVAAGEGADAAGAEAAGAAGAEGAEGMGMTGMPMGGSGSGQQDKERQRQAWMHEDEDIWGVPKEDIGPVLG
jgi:uncharacterized protein YukE